MVHVTVRFFGPAADIAGEPQVEYALAGPARLGDLIELLTVRYPRLASLAGAMRFAVNEEYADAGALLSDGDEVAVIPPVSGGNDPLVELTDKAITAADVTRRVAHPSCGAIITFEGAVRIEGSADNPLAALEYSAHESMALRLMQRIRAEALERFEVHEVAVVHRTGRLAVGELAVVVAVCAPHREDAFEACRWVIDAIKIDVPIWKREVWTRGETTWVDPTSRAEP